jgi:hypothetical protein
VVHEGEPALADPPPDKDADVADLDHGADDRIVLGANVTVFEIFSPKKCRKLWHFLLKTSARFFQKYDNNIGF